MYKSTFVLLCYNQKPDSNLGSALKIDTRQIPIMVNTEVILLAIISLLLLQQLGFSTYVVLTISRDQVCIEECINIVGKKIEEMSSSSSDDNTTLERFVKAQENCYNSVLKELRNGQKRSHWIWFIFPQAAELGKNNNNKKKNI